MEGGANRGCEGYVVNLDMSMRGLVCSLHSIAFSLCRYGSISGEAAGLLGSTHAITWIGMHSKGVDFFISLNRKEPSTKLSSLYAIHGRTVQIH
jgi:hypothetical protein